MSRSKHSLSNYVLTTLDLGQLIPIGFIPVLPGDIIGHSSNLLIRVSPLAAPVMHQVDARVHHYYVSNRVLWPDNAWENFITGGEDGMNTDTIPTINTSGTDEDLLDYLGLPQVSGIAVNALPVRMFNMIFNEFYRDQDLTTKRTEHDLSIPRISWGKDYFTTCRPWSQKGPAVSIPLGTSADIATTDAAVNVTVKHVADGVYHTMDASGGKLQMDAGTGNESNKLFADLTNATGADPIDVRTAWGLQRFMENAARFGSRYPEKMRQLGSAYKGLMERPVFLGGGQQAVNFSEVLQTANDTGDRAFGVGDMYGHGIAATRTAKYAHRADEHGYIMSVLSVRPATMYQDGIEREWLRQDREDFHDPFLEFIGQQEVYDNEIYAVDDAASSTVFGYQDRYDDYRHVRNRVTAEMKGVLDYWHLGRQFSAPPVLNNAFIECTPSKRIFNEQSQHSLWVMVHHKIAAHRNIAKTATARLI